MEHKKSEMPFTIEQLVFFRKELKNASEDFDVLMFEKDALKYEGSSLVIKEHDDREAYKKKHLIGVYEPLRKHYKTIAPYAFWGLMNELLPQLKRDRKQKFHLILKTEESIEENRNEK